jgi:hypothetical protein
MELALVSNSSFLNIDVGITVSDFKLRQTNHHIHLLVYHLVILLIDLLK